MQNRQVVLVDEQDKELGTADIYEAHRGRGQRHRALSVILYRQRERGFELLHQKRSSAKPIFKNLWSNTCCTNMRPGDEYIPRAVTRLQEEMGIVLRREDLRVLYRFGYEAPDLANPGWCENELDTVIVGEWDPSTSSGQGGMRLNPDEASDARWIEWGDLQQELKEHPEQFSPWHKMIVGDARFIRGLR